MTDSPEFPDPADRTGGPPDWTWRSGRSSRQSRSRAVPGRTAALVTAGFLAVAVVAGGIGFLLGSGAPDASQPAAVATGSPFETANGTPDQEASARDQTAEGIRATRIWIPRLEIDLEIVEGDGFDAPLDKAAHYPGTAWPGGEHNNVYIYGHAREGMFLSLWDAQVGDEVILELVDGTERRYIVTEVLPEVPWDALEYLDPTLTERLTLQTSTSYEPTSPKFIVIAVPAS